MKLDFLIPATPNDAFFSQIAFFRMCLDYIGGDYKNARLVATFGDHTSESIPDDWKPYFENIDIVWSHSIGAKNPGYRAQHYSRFEVIRPDADLAVLCDADTAILQSFPDIIKKCQSSPALFGVIAHYHFPIKGKARNPLEQWSEISQLVLGKNIDLEFNYTLRKPSPIPEAPFYINYGFLAGTPELLSKLYKRELELLDKASSVVGNFFGAQVALALSVADLKIPCEPLSMRYNYPNDRKADQRYPEELNNIIFMHYLRHTIFDRHKIFTSPQEFERFQKLDLIGSDLVFQKHVMKITKGIYPFPRSNY